MRRSNTIRHPQVEHDQVGQDRAHARQSLAAITGDGDAVSDAGERLREDLADDRVVIDDEDRQLGVHGPFSVPETGGERGRNNLMAKIIRRTRRAWTSQGPTGERLS
jgi:hypothetical protein